MFNMNFKNFKNLQKKTFQKQLESLNSKNPWIQDKKAIQGDWKKVGDEFRKIIK